MNLREKIENDMEVDCHGNTVLRSTLQIHVSRKIGEYEMKMFRVDRETIISYYRRQLADQIFHILYEDIVVDLLDIYEAAKRDLPKHAINKEVLALTKIQNLVENIDVMRNRALLAE